jgi:hypothetical protein
MKLTVNSKQVYLPTEAKISIEKTSPLLNTDTGVFSYPFPAPTAANQQLLGWPGRLQRVGDVVAQTFILEDDGLQIFRGEVEYDSITANEIGLILKSGYTEFYKKMEKKKLQDINFGSESWPISVGTSINITAINAKMAQWNLSNTVDNGKYVLTPYTIQMSYSPGQSLFVNKYHHSDGSSGISFPYTSNARTYACYGLQFKAFFIIEKIFESAGYSITEEVLSSYDFFKKLIVFGSILTIYTQNSGSISPVMTSLEYASIMPEIEVITFLETFQNMFCLVFDIDERKKEVRIRYKKDVFLPGSLDGMKINELQGWSHQEIPAKKGFKLSYMDQDEPLDTFTDYPQLVTAVGSVLPAPTPVDKIVFVASEDRDYMVVDVNDVLVWKQVGRLHEVKDGEGENALEINAKVPIQKQYTLGTGNTTWTFECPTFNTVTRQSGDHYTAMPFFAVSLYHGMKTWAGYASPFTNMPYTSFDKISIDKTIDTGMSLKPAFLYYNLHLAFLNWQTYRARPFTKYLQLTLRELLALQWGKRYTINSIEVILDKISFELPYKGIVKIEGYTN